jgi:signal transduction histidine kinase
MIQNEQPVPSNEMERIINLSEFDLDLSDFENTFKDLASLAAEITGTQISLVNLIDSYTQWTIANHGLEIQSMPREESVCQYTIMGNDAFEVNDLSKDDRFKNREYVKESLSLRYYLGVPLTTREGHQIGALCVLDTEKKQIEPEKIAFLNMIAREIVGRLQAMRTMKILRKQAESATELKKKVAHDIRGPISGIMGLSQLIKDQGEDNTIGEVLEFATLIHQSARSLLDLASEILDSETTKSTSTNERFTLAVFKEKLERLYELQARNKKIAFKVDIGPGDEKAAIAKDKLLQITGNLITNALKFTAPRGQVTVNLHLQTANSQNYLNITVKDSGIGLSHNEINAILNGTANSTSGTAGEQGFGFGLALVKHLVDGLQGTMRINSELGEGTTFEISLPQYSKELKNVSYVLQSDLVN